MANTTTIPPVFLLASEVPDDLSIPQLCSAAEKLTGFDGIFGAQRLGALWRLYPNTLQARTQLLCSGFTLNGQTIRPRDKNPFIVHDGSSEIPTTRLTIDGIPISGSDTDLEGQLKKLGVTLRSDIRLERARDPNGRLTHWVTGRRTVWIDVPKISLPTHTKVGIFRAKLYYREQERPPPKCNRCLMTGHIAANCTGDVVCRACRQPGHSQGDPQCDGPNVWGLTTQSAEGENGRIQDGSEKDDDEEEFVEAQGRRSEDGEGEDSSSEKEKEDEEVRADQETGKGGGKKGLEKAEDMKKSGGNEEKEKKKNQESQEKSKKTRVEMEGKGEGQKTLDKFLSGSRDRSESAKRKEPCQSHSPQSAEGK